MSEVKYSKEHEWIKVEGDVGTDWYYTTRN